MSSQSKAVVCTGTEPNEESEWKGEWQDDEEVTDVTIAVGVTEIKKQAFSGCMGLTNLSFLKDSAITTIGEMAFSESGIITLLGMEGVREIGSCAFG